MAISHCQKLTRNQLRVDYNPWIIHFAYNICSFFFQQTFIECSLKQVLCQQRWICKSIGQARCPLGCQSGRRGRPETGSDTPRWWMLSQRRQRPGSTLLTPQRWGLQSRLGVEPWKSLPHTPLACSGAQHHPDSRRRMPVSHSQKPLRPFLQGS